MLRWFIRFPELAEFSEFLFHLGKAPMYRSLWRNREIKNIDVFSLKKTWIWIISKHIVEINRMLNWILFVSDYNGCRSYVFHKFPKWPDIGSVHRYSTIWFYLALHYSSSEQRIIDKSSLRHLDGTCIEFINWNKKGFQYDAYNPLVDRGCGAVQGGAVWGCCPEGSCPGVGAALGVDVVWGGGAGEEGCCP